MENLVFHTSLRWKIIITTIATTFLFRKVGRMYFLNLGAKGLKKKTEARQPCCSSWRPWFARLKWRDRCRSSAVPPLPGPTKRKTRDSVTPRYPDDARGLNAVKNSGKRTRRSDKDGNLPRPQGRVEEYAWKPRSLRPFLRAELSTKIWPGWRNTVRRNDSWRFAR